MNTGSLPLSFRGRLLALLAIAALVLFLPLVVLGSGEGGGSDGGANDISVTVNGSVVGTSNAVTGHNAVSVGPAIDGTLSGTWGGMDVSYSPASGSWEASGSFGGGESGYGSYGGQGGGGPIDPCAGGGIYDPTCIESKAAGPLPPTVTLSARPKEVRYKETSNLTWTSANTTGTCTASGAWSGSGKALNNAAGEQTGELTAASNTFVLRCQGLDGTTAQSQDTVTVRHGQDADINVNGGDSATVRKDDEVAIDWNVGDSEPRYCEIRIGNVPIRTLGAGEGQGTMQYKAVGEATFTLWCEDGYNKASASIRVLPEFQET